MMDTSNMAMSKSVLVVFNRHSEKCSSFISTVQDAVKDVLKECVECCLSDGVSYSDIVSLMTQHRQVIFLSEHSDNIPMFEVAARYAFLEKSSHFSFVSFHVELEAGVVAQSRVESEDVLQYGTWNTNDVLQRLSGDCLTAGGYLSYGLAWTFSIGYLMKIANGFSEGVETASKSCGNLANKLLVVIPESGICPGKVVGCEPTGQSIERFMDVGGVRGRSFKHSVYAVKNPQNNDQVLHAALEYATPVRALMKISQFPGIIIPRNWLQNQVSTFAGLLQEISLEYGLDKVLEVVQFDDSAFLGQDQAAYSSDENILQNMRQRVFEAAEATHTVGQTCLLS